MMGAASVLTRAISTRVVKSIGPMKLLARATLAMTPLQDGGDLSHHAGQQGGAAVKSQSEAVTVWVCMLTVTGSWDFEPF